MASESGSGDLVTVALTTVGGGVVGVVFAEGIGGGALATLLRPLPPLPPQAANDRLKAINETIVSCFIIYLPQSGNNQWLTIPARLPP
ncbi:MAG: hypothetical protein ABIS10_03530 [Novosphingobium sp.]